MTRSGLADAPSEFRMLREKIGSVEDDPTDAFHSFRVISSNETRNFVQVACGSRTEPGKDHERWRKSSVVLD